MRMTIGTVYKIGPSSTVEGLVQHSFPPMSCSSHSFETIPSQCHSTEKELCRIKPIDHPDLYYFIMSSYLLVTRNQFMEAMPVPVVSTSSVKTAISICIRYSIFLTIGLLIIDTVVKNVGIGQLMLL